MSDESDQSDEILALKSIYGNKVVVCDTEIKPIQGKILVDVDPFQAFEDGEFKVSLDSNPDALVFIKHLNPVTFSFTLPQDYPSKSPPVFSLNIYWLSIDQTESLSKQMKELWKEQCNSVILFTWFNFLQNESLTFLKVVSAIPLSQEKIIKLTEHNILKKEKDFRRSLQLCPVCFIDKPGSQCKKLINCGHVFCIACLRDYLELAIREGSVSSIECMLGECSAQVNPHDVKSQVSLELFSRYDRLLLQSSLDCMSDVQYCPRADCRCAVIVDKAHNVGSCLQCGFSFCTYCRALYHGTEKCKFQTSDKDMYKQYTEADEEEKKRLEEMYGEKRLANMVSVCQSLMWMEKSTISCPKCQRPIEHAIQNTDQPLKKIDGCNKMTCTKCLTYFCWVCGKMLDKASPYQHYSDKSSKCYNKLFQGVETDVDMDEDDFFNLRDDEDEE